MNMEEFRSGDAFPYYLTQHERAELAEALKSFTERSALYTLAFQDEVLQGDCFDKIPFYDYARGKSDAVRVVVLSNSCDIDPANKRDLPVMITCAPVIDLDGFARVLEGKGVARDSIASKLSEIKRQRITNMLYLPSGQATPIEAVALLDRAFSIPFTLFEAATDKVKNFSLNQLGHYLICFKLSVHFCRLHEAISRG